VSTVLREAAARAPSTPGVYVFLADDGELLYVGKAADIRARLRGHAGATATSGRMRVLYDAAAEVRWEELPDEASAVAREADLIVALRPRCNAAMRDDGRWTFLNVSYGDGGDGGLELDQEREPRGRLSYGCFPHLGPGLAGRPGIDCTEGYVALLRLVWAASGASGRYPAAVAGASAGRTVRLALDPSLRPALHALLSGTSARVLSALLVAARERDAFLQPGIRRDHEAAMAFYRSGPAALRRLRLRHRLPAGPMSREVFVPLLEQELRAAVGDFVLPRPDLQTELGRRNRPWMAADT
jgi:hypothetical protein